MRPIAPMLAFAILLATPVAPAASGSEGVTVEVVAEGLDMPVDLAWGPDGTLYYVELMAGGLRAIPAGAEAPLPDPLWTAPGLQTGGERGLVGLALDPRFAETGAFYVFYTHNASGEVTNRVSRVVDGEETVLLGELRAGLLHNSGRILFLEDETMLVSLGDATLDTVGRDKAMHAHDPGDLNGKVLRLRRDGSVPDDNPWGNAVWTKGHRNVYGMAVSPGGMVLATENGPEKGDEVNVLEKGADYGWPTCAGPCEEGGDWVDPVLWYSPTIAPTGMTWYRGAFYFGDFNPAHIHRTYLDAEGAWTDEKVASFGGERVLDVEAGPEGLYVATWDTIYRLRLDERWEREDGAGAPPDEDDVPDDGPDAVEGAKGTPAPGALPLALTLVATAWVVRRHRAAR